MLSLLVFTIISTELQIGMNDLYAGEFVSPSPTSRMPLALLLMCSRSPPLSQHWDFPGTLTLLLTVPSIWAVIKGQSSLPPFPQSGFASARN